MDPAPRRISGALLEKQQSFSVFISAAVQCGRCRDACRVVLVNLNSQFLLSIPGSHIVEGSNVPKVKTENNNNNNRLLVHTQYVLRAQVTYPTLEKKEKKKQYPPASFVFLLTTIHRLVLVTLFVCAVTIDMLQVEAIRSD
jgi:hypothetical protein